jgi:hypothetical protein
MTQNASATKIFKPLRVLIACEFSATVRRAFEALGHNAWSADLLDSDVPGNHITGDVLKVLNDGWDLMIAHPPCTYLTNAGVRHLHDHVQFKTGKRTSESGSARWVKMFEGARFFNALKNAPIMHICIENPIPHGYATDLIGKYTQKIQPWQFGHGETKATCLWLKRLPELVPTNIVDGRHARCHLTPPSADRWKIRSKTYEGIAEAFAIQFSEYVIKCRQNIQ